MINYEGTGATNLDHATHQIISSIIINLETSVTLNPQYASELMPSTVQASCINYFK